MIHFEILQHIHIYIYNYNYNYNQIQPKNKRGLRKILIKKKFNIIIYNTF